MSALRCAWCDRAVSASREGHWTNWATEVGPSRWMCRVCRRRGSIVIPPAEDGLSTSAFTGAFKAIGVRVVPVQDVECTVAWIRKMNLLIVDSDVDADTRRRIVETYLPQILKRRSEDR